MAPKIHDVGDVYKKGGKTGKLTKEKKKYPPKCRESYKIESPR